MRRMAIFRCRSRSFCACVRDYAAANIIISWRRVPWKFWQRIRMTRQHWALLGGCLRRFGKAQRCGIHAVAQPGRSRTIVEYVTQVRVTFGAGNCDALHPDAVVGSLAHIFFCDGFPETGPAGSGIELGFGTEQRVVAADAAEDSSVVNIQQLPGVRQFGIRMPSDLEYSGWQLLPPLCFGFHYV